MAATRVVVFGLGPRYKGGIANYTTSLAKAIERCGIETHLVSWTQQYPAIIPRDFIDRSSRTDLLEGTGIRVHYMTNFNNPFSWQKTYRYLVGLKPDIVVFQWSLAIQGVPLGFIARKLSKHAGIETIFDLHFVKQKESSSIDDLLTRYGIRRADTYIVHSLKTYDELQQLFPAADFALTDTGSRSPGNGKAVIRLYHPVYDIYQPDPDFDIAAQKRALNLRQHVFLYFGFIRRYKGLHNALQAFAKVCAERDDVSFLIVGESLWDTLDPKKLSTKLKFWMFKFVTKVIVRKAESGLNYRPLDLVDSLGIHDAVKIVNHYVPNEDVHKYLQVSECMILFYLTATPSGVESLAYNFNLPILATRVGHFPETIDDGENGYLAEAEDIDSMAEAMLKFLENPIPPANVARKAAQMSWQNYAEAILKDQAETGSG